jgi:thiamine-phosphate pyrophosphorylase
VSEPPCIDPDEAGCRLILASPRTLEPETFAPVLDRALEAGTPAAFLLDLDDPRALPAAAAVLAPVCRAREVAFFVRADADTVLALGADGALVGEREVAAARARLGPDRILGAACGLSRHAAMLAGEAGADYLLFGDLDRPLAEQGPAVEQAKWWSEVFVVPAALAGRIEVEEVALVARAVDFLAVRDPVWQHPGGAGHAVASLEQAIRRARP